MIGRFFCWLGWHVPPKKNRKGRGIWVCTRRGCGSIVSRPWP